MGICGSSANLTEEQLNQKKKSEALDKAAETDLQQDQAIKKLLLLGAGESGKSTLFKQAIKLYGKGYSAEERATYTTIIINNVLTSIQTLLKYSVELKCGVTSQNQAAFQEIQAMRQDSPTLSDSQARAISALWADEGIRRTYDRRSEYQLNDSTEYFLNQVMEIAKPAYLPSEQDVLRSRVRTTGIVETSFLIDKNTFKMFDVGGQRNERKKWIHCFENVTSVLFVAAISEYDQKLYEDEATNRMTEALTLFEEIVNSRWFKKTSIILFLNKKDLFATKLLKTPITDCPDFADYEGDGSYDDCCLYIKEKFEQKCEDQTKTIFSHITTATDTENIKVVFNAVKQTIIEASLRDGGLL